MKSIFSFFTVVVLFVSCNEPKDTDNCHYKIKFKNNTAKVLYLYPAQDSVIPDRDIRTDPYFKPTPAHAGNGTIEAGTIRFTGGGKPMCIESLYPLEQKFYIYLLDSAAISQISWKEVVDENLAVKRFDISVKELQKNDFLLEYREE
ncbi:hypothetical protein [Flavobacterium sp. 1355]|jgi:hypothetical protein|uniref:hypothetical protein n=1 Tax=Flavobacterium sp. 1355 TaxID=2806571 RepID=UPI001AE33598|nr:hypothetical protein [Flavobacterium sp. 1355]MBP1223069.1 hypothetical protein [Flavobacterium sp. 1355]